MTIINACMIKVIAAREKLKRACVKSITLAILWLLSGRKIGNISYGFQKTKRYLSYISINFVKLWSLRSPEEHLKINLL